MCTENGRAAMEQILDAAKTRVEQRGRRNVENDIKEKEPALYHFITRIAFDALIERSAALGHEARDAVYDAVWEAAIIAVEAYRVAQTPPAPARVAAGNARAGWTQVYAVRRRVVRVQTAAGRAISAACVLEADLLVRGMGVRREVGRLERIEPELAEYLMETSTRLYGRLEERVGSSRSAAALHRQVMLMTLTCIEALRRSV